MSVPDTTVPHYTQMVAAWTTRTHEIAQELDRAIDAISGKVHMYTAFRNDLTEPEREALRELTRCASELHYALYGVPKSAEKLMALCTEATRALTQDLIGLIVLPEERAAEALKADVIVHRWELLKFANFCASASDCMTRLLVLWHFSPLMRVDTVAVAKILAELPCLPGADA